MYIFYTFIVGIFFSGLLFYLTHVALIPYNSEKLLDVKNLSIVTVIFLVAVTCFVAVVHLVVDKLFFRKFYEKPRRAVAYRRGFIVSMLLAGLAWIRVFGFWFWHIVLLYVFLVALIEFLFVFWKRKYITDNNRLEQNNDKLGS